MEERELSQSHGHSLTPLDALIEVEKTIEHDIQAALVTENIVGSVTIPSTPPISVTAPYLFVLALLVFMLMLTDHAIRQRTPPIIVTREFKTFQTAYLRVYLCALSAEWLQDSHLFALLLRHGHSVGQVASLYAASFVVSYSCGVLGSFLPQGGSGFLGGQRRACIVCFTLYALAALTVFHDDYATLLVGRVLYGSASALQHTVFVGWMNGQHASHAFPEDWLVQTYQAASRATVAVSIGSGVAAELCAGFAGLAAPFVASLSACLMGCAFIASSWPQVPGDGLNCHAGCDDNEYGAYGGRGGQGVLGAVVGAVAGAVGAVGEFASSAEGKGALHLVFVQAGFETAMYLVLFLWTPTLNASAVELHGIGVPPPYGVIFALLMASLMLGSHVCQISMSSSDGGGGGLSCLQPEAVASAVCACAGVACLVLALVGQTAHWAGLLSLLGFQFCVGVYYPTIGHLRGKYVPLESRAAAAHLAKTLLVLNVLVLLLNLASMPSMVFLVCALVLGVAVFALHHASPDFAHALELTEQRRRQEEEEGSGNSDSDSFSENDSQDRGLLKNKR